MQPGAKKKKELVTRTLTTALFAHPKAKLNCAAFLFQMTDKLPPSHNSEFTACKYRLDLRNRGKVKFGSKIQIFSNI